MDLLNQVTGNMWKKSKDKPIGKPYVLDREIPETDTKMTDLQQMNESE